MLTESDYLTYVMREFPRLNMLDRDHVSAYCPSCQTTVGLVTTEQHVHYKHKPSGPKYVAYDWQLPSPVKMECPVCGRFQIWILQNVGINDDDSPRIYRLMQLPGIGPAYIDALPVKPTSLRKAYAEATRSLDNGCCMAAAAMFRRALQVIAIDILGGSGKTLDMQLESVVGKSFDGRIVSPQFKEAAEIIRKCGNQGAHPDSDPDLLEFTPKDASALHDVFIDVVAELFVMPAAARKARDELMARRKLKPSP